MDDDMKVSASTIRKLRTERGWSQEQLALAAGVSLRTIQRVEAEGIASISTAVCIAATYDVKLIEIQEEHTAARHVTLGYGLLFLGMAIVTLATLSESGRLPGPQADILAFLNMATAILGALLLLPTLAASIKQRQYAGVALSALGVPLVTLSASGLIFQLAHGVTLNWLLGVFGLGGAGLLAIAIREFRRGGAKVFA